MLDIDFFTSADSVMLLLHNSSGDTVIALAQTLTTLKQVAVSHVGGGDDAEAEEASSSSILQLLDAYVIFC